MSVPMENQTQGIKRKAHYDAERSSRSNSPTPPSSSPNSSPTSSPMLSSTPPYEMLDYSSPAKRRRVAVVILCHDGEFPSTSSKLREYESQVLFYTSH